MRTGPPAWRREGREPGARERRGPAAALALSLGVHGGALALLAVLLVEETRPEPEIPAVVIDVVMGAPAMEAEAPERGAGAEESEVAEAAPAEELAVEPAIPDPAPESIPEPVPDPAPPVAEEAPAVAPPPRRKPAPPRAAPPPASPAMTTVAARPGPAAPPAAGSGAGLDAAPSGPSTNPGWAGTGDAMPAYLEQVRRRLQAGLAVPAEARRLRLGGTVVVRFAIGMDGTVAESSIAVVSGGGVAVLAQAAVAAVVRAAPLLPPPKPAVVEVPVVFAVR